MSLPLVFHDDYVTPLPAGHRFPMPKFGMLRDLLLADGVATPGQFHRPTPASRDWLTLVHEPEYVDAFVHGTVDRQAIRRIGLPWSPGLATRTKTAVGGTVLTARLAVRHGLACNTAGGTHHAFPDFGSGFCIFNDLAVAARLLREEQTVDRVMIIDLDVHQGDGTALIFADEPGVFTLSAHCGKNFPARKQTSDLDIALPPDMRDADYLAMVRQRVLPTLDDWRPDLVLYDAGVDPHADDRLGLLALTDDGLAERDAAVIAACVDREIPVACVIGGGYDNDLAALTARHSILHRVASRIFDAALV